MDKNWNALASRIIRREMFDRDMTYKGLALLLKDKVGVDYAEKALSNKVKRGTFSFAFFLQCAEALDLKDLRLDDRVVRLTRAHASEKK